MTQQIHSFRDSGVRCFQAACVFAFELSAMRKSVGVLCTGPSLPVLLSFIVSSFHRNRTGNITLSEQSGLTAIGGEATGRMRFST